MNGFASRQAGQCGNGPTSAPLLRLRSRLVVSLSMPQAPLLLAPPPALQTASLLLLLPLLLLLLLLHRCCRVGGGPAVVAIGDERCLDCRVRGMR